MPNSLAGFQGDFLDLTQTQKSLRTGAHLDRGRDDIILNARNQAASPLGCGVHTAGALKPEQAGLSAWQGSDDPHQVQQVFGSL